MLVNDDIEMVFFEHLHVNMCKLKHIMVNIYDYTINRRS